MHEKSLVAAGFVHMRRYVIFACAGISLLMHAMDVTMVAVAFPDLMKEFSAQVHWAGWTISIYLVAVTSVMPLMGTLSDTLGRKNVFLASLGLFTASSLACGLAPNVYTLIFFRFLQGLGGASFFPTSAGIISDLFPKRRETAIGLMSSTVPQDRFPEAIAWLFPLLGDDDRENMIRIWQMVLPPPAFSGVKQLIRQAIPDGWAELTRRIPGLA